MKIKFLDEERCQIEDFHFLSRSVFHAARKQWSIAPADYISACQEMMPDSAVTERGFCAQN